MEASNIPAFQTEEYMPPPNEMKSRVDFIYEAAAPDKDSNAFWQRIKEHIVVSVPADTEIYVTLQKPVKA